ncbi:MAG: DUF2779 domain-containing protein, partial [Myxococcales bacterium]
MQAHRLSKSRFIAGWQCHKQLWWRTHEPDAPELVPDESLQATFDRGRRVGETARAYVPGGVLVEFPHDRVDERLRTTAEALASGAPAVYEASFVADGVFVAVDILERAGGGWNLVEVKSTTRAKEEHLPDVAVQLHVLERAGLRVGRIDLMHLNRECRFPDLGDLFFRTDLTAEARAMLPRVRQEIGAQLRMLDGPLPDVKPGDQCDSPHECPFKSRCLPELPRHHVSTLYRLAKDKAAELARRGCITILKLPPDYPLSEIASRQVRAVRANRLVVEPGLRAALAAWMPPIAFLDFETVAPAIPVWRGCRPYDAVPVQFSCHMLRADGSLAHAAWLADGAGDPRTEFVARVADSVSGANVILAWNASFERRCLEEIKASLPDLARPIDDIVRRIGDLLPVVRNHVYHPDFNGSFSIKSVLPALVPGMGYDGLEIAEGQAASDALEIMLLHGEEMPAGERAHLRENLLRYCETDTLA